jgi:hypothetical protein
MTRATDRYRMLYRTMIRYSQYSTFTLRSNGFELSEACIYKPEMLRSLQRVDPGGLPGSISPSSPIIHQP